MLIERFCPKAHSDIITQYKILQKDERERYKDGWGILFPLKI